MTSLTIHSAPEVAAKFEAYPAPVRHKMEALRQLVLDTANELDDVTNLEETLKWGEPSYVAPKGSAIRMDWKEKTPGQYAMYFQCTSKLVPTFKRVYGNLFAFEGTRAIIFPLNEELPTAELKNCIAAGLRYHKVKNQPMLAM